MKGYSISLNMRTQVDKTNILPYFLLTLFFNLLHMGAWFCAYKFFFRFTLHSFLSIACIALQFFILFLYNPFDDSPKMGMQNFQFFPCLFCLYAIRFCALTAFLYSFANYEFWQRNGRKMMRRNIYYIGEIKINFVSIKLGCIHWTSFTYGGTKNSKW